VQKQLCNNTKTDKKQRKSKQTKTHTQGNNKNNEGKQRKKHKWKHAECDHVKKDRKIAAKQNPSSI
jgi:hypothetical protein